MRVDDKQLESFITSLKDQGIISDEHINKFLLSKSSPDMQELADMMHGVMCQENHEEPNMDCFFYMEDQLDEPWSEDDHETWVDNAHSWCEKEKLPPGELKGILREAAKLVGLIMLLKYPEASVRCLNSLLKIQLPEI